MLIDNVNPREVFSENLKSSCQARRINRVAITHEMDVFDARRGVLELAMNAKFSLEQGHYLMTAITELASNIVFHTTGGEITLDALEVSPVSLVQAQTVIVGFCVTARDTGPGISDLSLAFQDGYSTKSSLGCGLPGVRRLMDDIKVDTSSKGTVISATLWNTSQFEREHFNG